MRLADHNLLAAIASYPEGVTLRELYAPKLVPLMEADRVGRIWEQGLVSREAGGVYRVTAEGLAVLEAGKADRFGSRGGKERDKSEGTNAARRSAGGGRHYLRKGR